MSVIRLLTDQEVVALSFLAGQIVIDRVQNRVAENTDGALGLLESCREALVGDADAWFESCFGPESQWYALDACGAQVMNAAYLAESLINDADTWPGDEFWMAEAVQRAVRLCK